MIKVLKRPYDDKNITLRVGTHNGIFHCDEMIAICLINIIFNNIKDIEVIRSRNLKLLNKYTHLLIDIGGGKYDHHQIGGNGERKNGIKYASSGLVWKDFGKDIIKLLSEEN